MNVNFYIPPFLFLVFNFNFQHGVRNEVAAIPLDNSGFVSSMEVVDPGDLNRPLKTSIIYIDPTDAPLFKKRKMKKKKIKLKGKKKISHYKLTAKGSKKKKRGKKRRKVKESGWKTWKESKYGGNSKMSGSKSSEKRNPVDIIVHIKMKE